MQDLALGLIETKGLIAAIEAADAGLKAADVKLLAKYKADAMLVTVQFVGEVAAVRAAVDAGSQAASKLGTVVSSHVIPRPIEDVFEELMIPDKRNQVVYTEEEMSLEGMNYNQLVDLSVKDLRGLARQAKDFGIKGREISRANKDQLLDEFKKIL